MVRITFHFKDETDKLVDFIDTIEESDISSELQQFLENARDLLDSTNFILYQIDIVE